MASGDDSANCRSNRLSSFSVYDDPPLTSPDVIKHQLDLELKLKGCIEQLIRAYLDSDSLDKIEELTDHQLSCCGRISGHRLQLLRLRRSVSLGDQYFGENPVELPHDILSTETCAVTVFDIFPQRSDMEMNQADSTVNTKDDSSPTVEADLSIDPVTDAALDAMVEPFVNEIIRNSVAHLLSQAAGKATSNHLTSPVKAPEEEDVEKEKEVVKHKSADVNNLDDHNMAGKEDGIVTARDEIGHFKDTSPDLEDDKSSSNANILDSTQQIKKDELVDMASNQEKFEHSSEQKTADTSLSTTSDPTEGLAESCDSVVLKSNATNDSLLAVSPDPSKNIPSSEQPSSPKSASLIRKPRAATAVTSYKSQTLDPTLANAGKKLSKQSLGVAAVTPLGAFSTFEWDPSCLLEELYIDYKPISPPGVQPSRLVVEMEKLPRNQVKKTIAKGWKKRHFCITSGNLYYYEDKKMSKPLGVMKLNGAKIVHESLSIKVTDKLNQTIVIRGRPENAYLLYRSLLLESVHPTLTSIVSPYPGSGHPTVIVDIGSCSVRAGFAQGEAYPRLFFPAVCSVVKDTDEIQSCGLNALLPSVRQNCEIVFPTRQKLRMDQQTSWATRYIHFFLLHIFKELKVEPSSAKVIMTLPQNYNEKDKEMLMELLLENLCCEAACLLEQTILSLYSYGATSGIVVDIGDRTDIVPIIDGFKIESGITKLQVGGASATECLRRLSTEFGLRYFSDVEFYITRLIKEKIGFVSQEFGVDLERCTADTAGYTRALDVGQYELPDRKTVVAMASPLFRALEGFFHPSELWGKDIQGVPELIWKAIQSCDVDHRKEMSRSIFLSGGATLSTGFQERLERELTAIAPTSCPIQIQASVSRYHAAFLGAAVLASLDSFQDSWITKEDFALLRT